MSCIHTVCARPIQQGLLLSAQEDARTISFLESVEYPKPMSSVYYYAAQPLNDPSSAVYLRQIAPEGNTGGNLLKVHTHAGLRRATINRECTTALMVLPVILLYHTSIMYSWLRHTGARTRTSQEEAKKSINSVEEAGREAVRRER